MDNYWSTKQLLADDNPIIVSVYTESSYLTHGDRLWFLDAIVASGATSILVGTTRATAWIQACLDYNLPLHPFTPVDVFAPCIVIGTSSQYCASIDYFRDLECRQPLYQWLDRLKFTEATMEGP
ncbi:MAG: hypothetical protein E6R03_08480 [Hyphomicrobiaceae bacterium]|nr:MAG: hypothetical protein E6R03_08480 [Hyphomicrobiaceae bacterium]